MDRGHAENFSMISLEGRAATECYVGMSAVMLIAGCIGIPSLLELGVCVHTCA